MAISIFDEKANEPQVEQLAMALGTTSDLWNGLQGYLNQEFPHMLYTWKFYSKAAGWSLVCKSHKRTLLYLMPCNNYFKVHMVYGERAVQAALQSDLPQAILSAISEATPYVEGRGFFTDVRTAQDLDTVKAMVQIKAAF